MGSPVWEKITEDGRPFGFQSESEKKALQEIEALKEDIAILKEDNERLIKMVSNKQCKVK